MKHNYQVSTYDLLSSLSLTVLLSPPVYSFFMFGPIPLPCLKYSLKIF